MLAEAYSLSFRHNDAQYCTQTFAEVRRKVQASSKNPNVFFGAAAVTGHRFNSLSACCLPVVCLSSACRLPGIFVVLPAKVFMVGWGPFGQV